MTDILQLNSIQKTKNVKMLPACQKPLSSIMIILYHFISWFPRFNLYNSETEN